MGCSFWWKGCSASQHNPAGRVPAARGLCPQASRKGFCRFSRHCRGPASWKIMSGTATSRRDTRVRMPRAHCGRSRGFRCTHLGERARETSSTAPVYLRRVECNFSEGCHGCCLRGCRCSYDCVRPHECVELQWARALGQCNPPSKPSRKCGPRQGSQGCAGVWAPQHGDSARHVQAC